MKNLFTLKTVLSCFTILFMQTAFMQAQWSDDANENTVVCDETKGQSFNCIVSDGLGNFIIGWKDWRDYADQTYGEIYAQKFNPEGYSQWTTNGIRINSAYGGTKLSTPSMVKSEDGKIITAWIKMGASFTDPAHNYVKKTDENGNGLWGNVKVFNLPYSEGKPVTTPDHSNGVIITCNYKSSSTWTATKDVIAQRINSSGDVMWGTTGITVCNAAGNQMYPSVTCNDSGDSYIVWKDSRNDTGGDIYAQMVDSFGNVKWTVNGIPVCNNSNGQDYPSVINDDERGVIIAWISKVYTDFKVYAQRLDEDGNKLWGSNGVSISDNTDFNPPVLVRDGSGGAFVVWVNTSGTDNDIYAQRIDKDGLIQWAAGGVVVSAASGNQTSPAAIPDGTGGLIIAWSDYRNDAANPDIYAQRLNNTGTPLWPANGAAVSTASGIQENPNLTSDGDGGAVIVWDDTRNGNYDIYAQHIDKDGKPGGTATMVMPPENNENAITVYPNPFSDNLYLKLRNIENNNTVVRIFRIDGALVKEMQCGSKKYLNIPVAELKKGMYIFEVKGSKINYQSKIIKQ